MKHCIQKIYCDSCRRMVRGIEQAVDNRVHVSCSKCSRPMWVWDGVTWKYIPKSA